MADLSSYLNDTANYVGNLWKNITGGSDTTPSWGADMVNNAISQYYSPQTFEPVSTDPASYGLVRNSSGGWGEPSPSWLQHPIDNMIDLADSGSDWAEEHKTTASILPGLVAGITAIPAARRKAAYEEQMMQWAAQDRAARQAAVARSNAPQDPRFIAPARVRIANLPPVNTTYGRAGGQRDQAMYTGGGPDINYVQRAAGGGSIGGTCHACGGLATYARGGSPGQADNVPAMLSNGEFVVPADVVAHLGDGNNEAGANRLHSLMRNVRQQKISSGAGLPPAARDPMSYMKGGK